ncbi:MAG: acetyl-CoA carboxylase biotin carboxyl carrier protein [Firmicutes bacterium]|nr:acetyl-CoA carboxylase biotin carboxyl carrier protein [Bacillota bacterium]
MDLKEIERLWDRFDRSEASEMQIQKGEFSFSLKKAYVTELSAATPPGTRFPRPLEEPEEEKTEEEALPIKAPLAGTFYRAASPEADAFVNAGAAVAKGQVVCIIEAMKMINEIRSPYAGIVKTIAVNNGQLVGLDQPLMYLEKTDV